MNAHGSNFEKSFAQGVNLSPAERSTHVSPYRDDVICFTANLEGGRRDTREGQEGSLSASQQRSRPRATQRANGPGPWKKDQRWNDTDEAIRAKTSACDTQGGNLDKQIKLGVAAIVVAVFVVSAPLASSRPRTRRHRRLLRSFSLRRLVRLRAVLLAQPSRPLALPVARYLVYAPTSLLGGGPVRHQ